MGKCLSCFKPSSSYNQDIAIKRDCTIQKDRSVFKNTLCAVPHLQSVNVLVDKNGHRIRTLTQTSNDNNCDIKDSAGCQLHSSAHVSKKIRTSVGEVKILKSVSDTKINRMYDAYKDSMEHNFILLEGIENLCSDLNLLPDEFKVLVLAWKFDAHQMCQFSREEFATGCKKLGADSIKSMQLRLAELVEELISSRELFKSLYKYTFDFGLDNNIGQRLLPIEIAISLWRLVFTIHEPPILSKWIKFLQNNAQIRGIPRDTWNMFLNFSEFVGNDLSDYDDTEAWPSIFDEFVEFENDQTDQKYI